MDKLGVSVNWSSIAPVRGMLIHAHKRLCSSVLCWDYCLAGYHVCDKKLFRGFIPGGKSLCLFFALREKGG